MKSSKQNKPYFYLFLLTELFTESCSCRDFAIREESYTHRCVLPPNPSFTPFSAGGRHVSEVSWHRDIVYHSCPPPHSIYPSGILLEAQRWNILSIFFHVLFTSPLVALFTLSFYFCPFYCLKFCILSSPGHFTLQIWANSQYQSTGVQLDDLK